jgi:hypothetical protein
MGDATTAGTPDTERVDGRIDCPGGRMAAPEDILADTLKEAVKEASTPGSSSALAGCFCSCWSFLTG